MTGSGEQSGGGRWARIATSVTLCLTLVSTARADSKATASRATTHCRTGETILYSCRFGKSVGSVCGAPGKLSYRFGPAGRPDIDIASAPDGANIRLGHVTGQGGGHQTHVRFSRGDTHYIVYEGANGSLAVDPGHLYSGIAVLQGADGGRELATLACHAKAMQHPDFADELAGYLPSADPEHLAEQTDGPFDAWF